MNMKRHRGCRVRHIKRILLLIKDETFRGHVRIAQLEVEFPVGASEVVVEVDEAGIKFRRRIVAIVVEPIVSREVFLRSRRILPCQKSFSRRFAITFTILKQLN